MVAPDPSLSLSSSASTTSPTLIAWLTTPLPRRNPHTTPRLLLSPPRWHGQLECLICSSLLVHVLAIYDALIDVLCLCIRAHMLRYRYELHTMIVMLTVYSWVRLINKVPIFPAIGRHGFLCLQFN